MNVTTRTTRAELAEKVRSLDVDMDVVQQIVNQLRRISGYDRGMWSGDRQRQAVDLAVRYLKL